jgi:hypothetical protein
MAVRRDRVNRVKGLVYLPIDGSRLVKGDTLSLEHVKEELIDCAIRDALVMKEPREGDSVGDAVFDAMARGGEVRTERCIGYVSAGVSFCIVTEDNRAISVNSTVIKSNVCDANLV